MKAIEQYFHVVLFIMLYKVVLTFKSVDETQVCGNRQYSYSPTSLGREPSEHECEANAGNFARNYKETMENCD